MWPFKKKDKKPVWSPDPDKRGLAHPRGKGFQPTICPNCDDRVLKQEDGEIWDVYQYQDMGGSVEGQRGKAQCKICGAWDKWDHGEDNPLPNMNIRN